jgi:hypothetical protein
LAVAIWCAAVARASPSVAYFRFPLTGHFDLLSTTIPAAFFFDVNYRGTTIICHYKLIRQFLIMPKSGLTRCPKFRQLFSNSTTRYYSPVHFGRIA